MQHLSRLAPRLLVATALGLITLSLQGCVLGQLVGGMAASAERSGKKLVKAKYTGLEDKSFAVVVQADRSIQADHPDIVPLITREVTRRLSESAGASGVVPADEVLRFQYQTPRWVAMSAADLASELGVDRLILVELRDYAMNDPGNAYIWNGRAAAAVRVLEADSKIPDTFAFQDLLRVRYPDQEGLGPAQIPEETIRLVLAKRIIDRISWLFFDHEESNIIEY